MSILYDETFMKRNFDYKGRLALGTEDETAKHTMSKVIKSIEPKLVFDSGCSKGTNFTHTFIKKVYPSGKVYAVDVNKRGADICRFIYSESGCLSKYSDNIIVYNQQSLIILRQLTHLPIKFFFLDTTPENIYVEIPFIRTHFSEGHIFVHDWFFDKGTIARQYGAIHEDSEIGYIKFNKPGKDDRSILEKIGYL